MSDTWVNLLVRLATASGTQEAELWRLALEAEGIPCRIVGKVRGPYSDGSPRPEIWVFHADVEMARRILQRASASGDVGS
jgi:hypothetical protein